MEKLSVGKKRTHAEQSLNLTYAKRDRRHVVEAIKSNAQENERTDRKTEGTKQQKGTS